MGWFGSVTRKHVTVGPQSRTPRGVAATALLLAGCGSEMAGTASSRAPEEAPSAAATVSVEPLKATFDDHGHPIGLHQYNPYTDKITSGAQPEGEEAFRNLAALGYRTIVSVDGAKPDLELAHKYGLRYVHVPTQYSGTRPDQVAKIAKAIETSDGPVYVHCHHGKHRSPGALGAVCVSMGLITKEQAIEEMHVSGTDPKYKGLYRDVMEAKPLTTEELAAVPADLPEFVRPDDIAASMVDVDRRWDNLKASKEAKWGVPPASPDVDPPHEARMLWEHFREIARLEDVAKQTEEFRKFLSSSEDATKALEDALRAKDAKSADAAFDAVKKDCASCHTKFRDN